MTIETKSLNPFPGLRPFRQDEDYLFFGREEQTLELLKRLQSNRLLAVVGTSGSGKSSLVRCGLMSELQGGNMLGAGTLWEVAITHPGGNPMSLLADALLEADVYDRDEPEVKERLLATLSRSHFGLVEAVRQAHFPEGTNFLLVVDQFEELFRFSAAGRMQSEVAREFVSTLLEACAQSEVPIYVVLTMRSDFIGDCSKFEKLAEAINSGEYLIPQLTWDQYKGVIEGPIRVGKGQITPRLLQRLLNDVRQGQDQLPCLQHALMRTWDIWSATDRSQPLDLPHYEQAGKTARALSLHADEIYDGLASDHQRTICECLFKALTTSESADRGVRRPQSLQRLCEIIDVKSYELEPVIGAFRCHGVTFLMPPPDVTLQENTVIDISHESLMRVWDRLRRWVEQEAQSVRIFQRLAESATLHQNDKVGLYRDPELGVAWSWREESVPNANWAQQYGGHFSEAMEYLDRSSEAEAQEDAEREAARQRELQQAKQLAQVESQRAAQQTQSAVRLRWLVRGLGLVALVAVSASLIAWQARDAAIVLRFGAEAASKRATVAETVAIKQKEAMRLAGYQSDMQLAASLLGSERSSAKQVRDILQLHQTKNDDLLDFSYYHTNHQLEHTSSVYQDTDESIASVAFGPGSTIFTVTRTGKFTQWGESQTAPLKRIDFAAEDTLDITDAQFSADGRLAAVATSDQKIHLFETPSGAPRGVLEVDHPIRGLDFYDDDRQLAVTMLEKKNEDDSQGSLDDMCGVVAFDLAACLPSEIGRFFIPQYGEKVVDVLLRRLGVSSNGTFVVPGVPLHVQASVFSDGIQRELISSHTLSQAAIASDSKTIVVGTTLGYVRIFTRFERSHRQSETKNFSMNQVSEKKPHINAVSSIEFSPDDHLVATGGKRGLVTVVDLSSDQSPKPHILLKGHSDRVVALRFDGSGGRLISSTDTGETRVWDLACSRDSIVLNTVASNNCVDFSNDGRLLATAFGNAFEIWNVTPLVRLHRSSLPDCRACAFSPDGKTLAIGGLQSVQLWDVNSGKELAFLPGEFPGDSQPGPGHGVGSLIFSPDGKYLAAGFGGHNIQVNTSNGAALVWSLDSQEQVLLAPNIAQVGSVDFSPDSRLFASVGRWGRVAVHELLTEGRPWQLLHEFVPKGAKGNGVELLNVQFSPDGETLAIQENSGNFQITLLDTSDWRELPPIENVDRNYALQFSSDGKRIFAGGTSHMIRGWDFESRRLIYSSPVEETILSMALSPDGRTLATGQMQSIVVRPTELPIWNTPRRAAAQLAEYLDQTHNAQWKQAALRAAQLHPETLRELCKLRPNDAQLQFAWAETLTWGGEDEAASHVTSVAEAACADLATIQDDEPLVLAYADALLGNELDPAAWHKLRKWEVESNAYRRTPPDQERGILVGDGPEVYTLETKCPVSRIQTLRLEVLPQLGGRDDFGRFMLHDLQAFNVTAEGEAFPIELVSTQPLTGTTRNSVDGEETTAWETEASQGAQYATYICRSTDEQPIETLRLVMRVGAEKTRRRLRFSVADQMSTAEQTRLHLQAAEAAGWWKLATVFYLAGQSEKAAEALDFARENLDASAETASSMQVLQALIYDQAGDPQAAKSTFAQATQLFPGWTWQKFELDLFRSGYQRLRELSETDAQAATLQFRRDCRTAYLSELHPQSISTPDLAKSTDELIRAEHWYDAAQEIERFGLTQGGAYQHWALGATLYALAVKKGQCSADAYHRFCERMIGEFSSDDRAAQLVLRSCWLIPDSDLDGLPTDALMEGLNRAKDSPHVSGTTTNILPSPVAGLVTKQTSKVKFVNKCDGRIRISWLEDLGKPKFMAYIEAGGEWEHWSEVGLTWLVTDVNDVPLGVYEAVEAPGVAVVDGSWSPGQRYTHGYGNPSERSLALAIATYRQGRFDEAVTNADQAITLSQNTSSATDEPGVAEDSIHAAALAVRSLALMAQDNTEEAQAALDAARALIGQHVEFHPNGDLVGRSLAQISRIYQPLLASVLLREAADAVVE